MDQRTSAPLKPQTSDTAILEEQPDPLVEATSQEYLGRWNRLISTTNWEKGRIICQWRDALIGSGSPPSSYTDETWSQRAGSLTPQHTGRLRRTYQRFGASYEQYAGLYWSHFQAALDWDDAEMWLEGAVQNGWSIAQMRQQRWETLGSPPDLRPRPEDVVVAELDEDTSPAGESGLSDAVGESVDEVRPADAGDDTVDLVDGDSDYDPASEPAESVPFRPFENLPALPPDLHEAFESMKLAILHHKMSGWEEVSCDAVLAAIDAIKHFTLAPAN